MNIIAAISKLGIIFYLLSSLIPLSKSEHWFIRAWDFPRLQLLIIGIILGFCFGITYQKNAPFNLFIIAGWLIGIGLDLYRVLPYSPLWPKESLHSKNANKERSISLITVNVLQYNKNPTPLLKILKDYSPDIIFLLEVNQRWLRDLESLTKLYPYKLEKPLENTYGLALYSKLDLVDAEVRELIEKDIPSIYTKVKLANEKQVELFGLHPRPPHYETGDSTERDAELVQVAKTVSKAKLPVIVMGDLNDVAWSHTTRLFRRLSKLLDPRVGRGPFPTFPATVPLLRFPLDYVFYSDDFTLVSIERLGDIESDHYPMFIEIELSPEKKDQQEAPSTDKGDEQEAQKTLQKVK